MNKILFLFGSGLSIKAEMPSTRDITQNVLNGSNIMRHTDGNYYFGKPLYNNIGMEDEYVPRIKEFIKIVKDEIDSYDQSIIQKETNYENLFYNISQIYDSQTFNNPIAKPFIDKISNQVYPLLQKRETDIHGKWELHQLADESLNYIHDITLHHLNKKPIQYSYLHFLQKAYEDSKIDHISIFTLNHDLVLEEYFNSICIPFIDGFDKPINNIRYWDINLFKNNHKLTLVKLHGSINWFKFRRKEYNPFIIGISMSSINSTWRTQAPNGEYQNLARGRPMFLVGTFNKILEYTYDIYFSLHYLFYETLNSLNTIILSGYSFGDRGINTRIIEWLTSKKERKMVIIHPDIEELKVNSREGIFFNWDNWVKENKFVFIQKKIEDITWDEISDKL